MPMGFFFIKRRVDPKPFLENAKILNIDFNTAICLRNIDEVLYILPRLMENLLKYIVAKKGGSPMHGIHLDFHLPFLLDMISGSDDVKRRKEVINKAFVLYDEMSEHRFSYLSGENPPIDIINLLNIYKSFIGYVEVYLDEKIF